MPLSSISPASRLMFSPSFFNPASSQAKPYFVALYFMFVRSKLSLDPAANDSHVRLLLIVCSSTEMTHAPSSTLTVRAQLSFVLPLYGPVPSVSVNVHGTVPSLVQLFANFIDTNSVPKNV